MHFHKIFRASLLRVLALSLLIAILLPAPAFCLDSEDSHIFISGFNAYQRNDYEVAADSMSTLLKKYPDTSLKEVAIFWLARADYKTGNRQQAAKHMAQFLREYPESPLKDRVEEELVTLARSYERGEPLQAPGIEVQKAPAAPAATASQTARSGAAERAGFLRLSGR